MLNQQERVITQVMEIPIEAICPNPNQPRQLFDQNELDSLRQSIAENGLLQPITVRRVQSGYELVSGERRVRACEDLQLKSIPAIIAEVSDEQSAVFALMENLQRTDLNFFEEARAIRRLLDITGLRQEELAAKLGKAPSTVANKLRISALPENLQKKLLDYHMTERHARALLKLIHLPAVLERTTSHICKNGYTVAQTEQYIEGLLKPQAQKQSFKLKLQDTRLFMNTIRKAITTMKLAGVDIRTVQDEDEQYVFYTMRIPKNAPCKQPQ